MESLSDSPTLSSSVSTPADSGFSFDETDGGLFCTSDCVRPARPPWRLSPSAPRSVETFLNLELFALKVDQWELEMEGLC